MLNLFALAVAAVSAPAAATPSSNMEFDRWERRLRHRVAELHAFPEGADKDWTGDVAVRFSVGPDGRPMNPIVQSSSGHPIFDRAARRLVRLLGPIGRVPATGGEGPGIVLILSYGEGGVGQRQTASAPVRFDGLQL